MSKVSNYPGGFANGVTIRGVPLQILHPGQVFWVNNSSVLARGGKGGSNTSPGTFLEPKSTLTGALAACQASRGDIIMVMPGHAENVATAGAIDVNKAGVAIVGLGAGTKRPKFSNSAAAGTFVISAANCSFYNLQWEANFLDVTIGLDISGVDGLTFSQCYFTDAGSNLNYIDTIDLATGADDIAFDNCKFLGKDAQNDGFIVGVAHGGFYVSDCFFHLNVAQAATVGLIETSGNTTNAWIKNSVFCSPIDDALILDFNGTANSGGVSNCYFSTIDTVGGVTAAFDLTGMHAFELYVAGDADSWGLVGGGTVYS